MVMFEREAAEAQANGVSQHERIVDLQNILFVKDTLVAEMLENVSRGKVLMVPVWVELQVLMEVKVTASKVSLVYLDEIMLP